MFEQAMIQGQVPFDLIFYEQMDDISRYRVLVLAGQDCLSDEHIARIEKYVTGGGALVFTGASGSRDQWVNPRSEPGLGSVLKPEVRWNPRRGMYADKTVVSRGGKVVYVPEITPPDRELAARWNGSWDGDQGRGPWILPANWKDLEQAVRTACGGRLSVEVEAPDWVVVEQTQKDKLIMVHLVNYRENDTRESIPVDVRLDQGRKVKSVKVVSPDRDGEQQLEFGIADGRVMFVVPELKVYDMIVIEQS